jgi:dihydrofolate reductase
MMRTIVYIGASLDGFIARQDNDIEWLVPFQNDEVIRDYEEFIKRVDGIVLGRGTFEKVLSFPHWPYTKKVFVLSTSITQVPDQLRDKAVILSMKPKPLINYLSTLGHSCIYVDGGKVIQSFLREDCIDEMIITRVPLLLGNGIPLFGRLDNELLFRHTGTRVLSNGLVKSYYEKVRN